MTGKMNEMMSDMGTTMIAGMLVSTVITLLFTPVYYCVIDDLTHRRERRKAKSSPPRRANHKTAKQNGRTALAVLPFIQ